MMPSLPRIPMGAAAMMSGKTPVKKIKGGAKPPMAMRPSGGSMKHPGGGLGIMGRPLAL